MSTENQQYGPSFRACKLYRRKREQIRKQLSALRKQHGADAVRLMFDVQLARRHPSLRKRLSPEAKEILNTQLAHTGIRKQANVTYH